MKYNYEIIKHLKVFDKMLEKSKLNEKDVNVVDHKVKRGILKKLRWSQ